MELTAGGWIEDLGMGKREKEKVKKTARKAQGREEGLGLLGLDTRSSRESSECMGTFPECCHSPLQWSGEPEDGLKELQGRVRDEQGGALIGRAQGVLSLTSTMDFI